MLDASATATARSVRLLTRGPAAMAPVGSKTGARASARAALLRVLRPYTVYQHQLDEAIVGALRRQGEQLERLELLAEDLVAAAERLGDRLEQGARRLSSVELLAGLHPMLLLGAQDGGSDPLAQLENAADGSLGAVAVAPDAGLARLLPVARRKLRPGGRLLVEVSGPEAANAALELCATAGFAADRASAHAVLATAPAPR